MMEDIGTGVAELLVARAVQVCCQVCCRVRCVQLDEDLPYAEGGEADPQQSPQPTLASDLHRHDWRTPRLKRLQCHPGGGGLPVQADPHYTYSHLPRLHRSCPAVPRTCLVSSQTSRGSDQRLQPCLHIQLIPQACSSPWS